jgi:crotonobetainyl-CoA:carnitine CoA-transferase CaiB-like acyl-CoA transferase
MSSENGVLAGITVLDVSEVMQAPLAAQVLGDLGARVIKIERPSGELMRKMDTHAVRHGLISSYFAALNRNKDSLPLDMKTEAGVDLMRHLAATADVLIHNYRPGVMERFGLGYDDLARANPRIIYAVATGYGESGPLSSRPGQDMAAQSLSGILSSSGRGGDPALSGTAAIDFASGMILAQGILAALLDRKTSGRGQKVSISLLDTAIAMQMCEAASHQMYGYTTHWVDRNLNWVFRTKDGHVTVLGFFRDNPLTLICKALGIADLGEREEFSDLAKQVARKQEIYKLIEGDFLRFSCDEILARLEAQDIICSPVLTLEEALEHPQVEHNEMVSTVDVEGQSPIRLVANPLKMSRTPPRIYRGPARLGAETVSILREAGLSEERIYELTSQGAVIAAENQNGRGET